MIMTTSAYRGIKVPSLRNIRPAAPAPEVEQVDAYTIKVTEAGARCGNHGKTPKGERHTYHANTASVRACYQLTAQMNADQEAEIAVELAYERHLEDRGYHEARAQEAWEQTNGMW
jgi:hypothetical protein